MTFSVWLSFIAAIVTAGIAVMALYRDPRSFAHRVFAAGMILFAIDAVLTGFTSQSTSFDDFLFRERLQLIAASFLPAVWLFFSVSFARANYSEQISSWKWVLFSSFILPVSMVALFNDAFYTGAPVPTGTSTLFLHIGRSGYVWHLLWVVSAVLIMMNLERTFRHATGHMRWQTKFMFLGIGGIFGAHLFTDSQAVLFKGIDTGLTDVNLGALLVADILILRSLFRGKPLNVSVHLSHQFLYNSFTALIVGIYFISVGMMAWFSVRFEWIRNIHVSIFLIFVAIVGIATLLLSDRFRIQRKRFISRHFKRPQYDYQKIWENFTEKTASVTQTGALCNIIVRMVSETLEILSVSIWLVDEKQERLFFGGSTVFTEKQVEKLPFYGQGGAALIRAMVDQTMPLDLNGRADDWVEDLKRTYEMEETRESRIRYCVPLKAAGHLIGIMTLSEKVFYQPVSFEESELLKTIADQAAAGLMNLRLSERLRQAKELEAFQSMSAFFMHDLKNLASKLSLVTQNLPVHLDNPEFRNDALRTISQSVAKINTMSSRLSLLSQKLELTCKQTDLNELVASTVSDLEEFIKAPIVRKFDAVPPLSIDREQIHKVLENLIINANDALNGGDGDITVGTKENGQWVEISVTDTGCGMTGEFMEKSLFRPFQTTKKQGMGIGLYHCKTIVEAHGGRIEAESEEGKGTIIRVLLIGASDKGMVNSNG
ncbi:MAG: PEP-CTERM system histidine kinase PrsK [Desulfobacteraceae bacterium]|nr:MAG: PEP-CTERM system histidine kinase PrsK [Desulfobacteraceae bacterium]